MRSTSKGHRPNKPVSADAIHNSLASHETRRLPEKGQKASRSSPFVFVDLLKLFASYRG
jgi:hypothetical protein